MGQKKSGSQNRKITIGKIEYQRGSWAIAYEFSDRLISKNNQKPSSLVWGVFIEKLLPLFLVFHSFLVPSSQKHNGDSRNHNYNRCPNPEVIVLNYPFCNLRHKS